MRSAPNAIACCLVRPLHRHKPACFTDATKKRASDLAHRICSNHLELRIDTVVRAVLMIFTAVTGFIPKFKVQGGSPRENLAMQNIQARIR